MNHFYQVSNYFPVYFSGKFGIYILRSEPLLPGKGYVTLLGESEKDYIKLPEGSDEVVDTFKLPVSTEPVDDFLLMQPGLELGKILSNQDLMEIEEPGREKVKKTQYSNTLRTASGSSR